MGARPNESERGCVYCDYGSPDVLRLQEIEKPVPNDNQVLIKVHAASVNPLEWHFLRGIPYVMRLETGLRKPKSPRLGTDVAGEVAAVGKNVTAFKPGDQVFGACDGAFDEYCLGKAQLTMNPASATYDEAAAGPLAGISALQGWRGQGDFQASPTGVPHGRAGG